MRPGPAHSAHALLAAVEQGGRVTLSSAGYSAPNIRFFSAIDMIRLLLEARRRSVPPERTRGLTLLQYDDHAFLEIRSLAFGRVVGAAPFVELIVDPYFFFSEGFKDIRAASAAGALPPWSERRDVVFWRGSGSHNGWTASGRRVETLHDIPRIAMALRLRDDPRADVGLVGAWNDQPEAETEAFLDAERILRPRADMLAHARYRYQLDIDGVANAWATLERLLTGSCVLKVATPFEMWFYPRLQPWVHYVPVRGDLEDLQERLDWCRSHEQGAREIAEAGRALALSLTYQGALDQAVKALSACRLPLGEAALADQAGGATDGRAVVKALPIRS